MGLAQVYALLAELKEPLVLHGKIPVEPVCFIVLTPTVIVAVFAVAKFIPGIDHGNALGQEQDQEHAPHPSES